MIQKQLFVFVVDDDLIYGMVALKTIQATGIDCRIMSFQYPQMCLDKLRSLLSENSDFPDFIFIDLNIPEMNGFEFIESLNEFKRKDLAPVKIYLMSSSRLEPDMARAKSNKLVKGFLEKPILKETFWQILSE